jgi:carboxypeptidase family protein
MRRLVAVVTMFVVFAAACSDSGGETLSDRVAGSPASVDLSTVVDLATAAAIDSYVESLGPEAAFRAVLYAFDNGYAPDQVTTAIGDGSLDVNGVIAAVEPVGANVGLIDRSGSSAHVPLVVAAGSLFVAGAEPLTAEEFKRGILDDAASMFLGLDLAAERKRQELSREAGRAMIATLLTLMNAGYSLEQVVQFVVFGDMTIQLIPTRKENCTVMAVDSRVVVDPADRPLPKLCAEFVDKMRRAASSTTTTTTADAALSVVTGVVFAVDTGHGIPGAVVTIVPGGPAAVTDGDGLFTLGEVPAGEHTITVTAEGFSDAMAQIEVASGEILDTTVALEGDFQFAFPRTYVGVGALTLSYSYASGSCRVEGQKLEMTLWEDGTVSGTWDYLNPVFSWNDQGDGKLALECKGSDPFGPTEVPGNHTPPTPGTVGQGHVVTYWPASLDDVRFEGDYTVNEMIIKWTSEFANEFRGESGFVYYGFDFVLKAVDG